MFNIGQNNKIVEVLSGPERREYRTPQEKIAIIQQTIEPGKTVSHIARLHGINANPPFKWHRQYEEDSLTAVESGEEVVPASELAGPVSKSASSSVFWAKNGLRMRPCLPGDDE